LRETSRLIELKEKVLNKKNEYKKSYKNLLSQQEEISNKYEKEIFYLKEKIYCDKKDIFIQTDIDSTNFSEMKQNHDLIVFHHKLVNL